MKKIEYLIIIVFTLFSFYYTEKIISAVKSKDPLMTVIEKEKKYLDIKPVNAIIKDDTIILGKSGKIINENASYEKMKLLDTYNSDLLEYDSISPSITKDNNYEKSITGVITENKELSLVFLLDDLSLYDELTFVLDDTYATIFIDGKYLEKIKKTSNISFGIYSYNDLFTTISTTHLKKVLSNYNSSNYCLYKDEEFLNVCKNLKINTIKPEIINNNVYKFFKDDKEIGKIYQVKVTKTNIKELASSIIYLKQKGYDIKPIAQLLEQ